MSSSRRFFITGISVMLLSVLMLSVGLPQLNAQSSNARSTDTQRDESFIAKQQALFDRLNVIEAWKITKGDPNVLVGIIDNGFDFFHPDLKDQLTPGFYSSGGYHTEFYQNMAHGTLVSSIIVARENNPGGMIGLAPRCRALTASQGMIEHKTAKVQSKYLQENPKASFAELQTEMKKHHEVLKKFGQEWSHYQSSGAADAIRYLVDHGVKVINISSAVNKSSTSSADVWKKLEDAFSYAAEKEVIIVLAAGNNDVQSEDYPGNSETVIVVGATLLNDTRWEEKELEFMGSKIKQGSNFGKRLSVMAPVEKLVVCTPHERRFYECDDGPMGATKLPFAETHEVMPNGATSSAAPIVTSLVALIYSANPALDAKSVVKIVTNGCDDVKKTGYNIYTGHGRVNFAKSVNLARDWGK